ncbi:SCP-like extracellular protein [Colletotrichum higginsianum]|nr:SCP-like extracellular protein [Colletotrichum higginsianum]
MHFSASTALGLGLLAAHAAAIVVPVKKDVGLSLPVTVTVTDAPLPVTVTITTPVTVTATVSISVTAGSNSTTSGANSTTISSTTSVTSTTPITTTTVLSIAVSTAVPATSAVPTTPETPETPETPTTPSTAGLTADQQRALDLHNTYRAEVGSPPLTWDAGLAESAQAWANHLTTVGSLVHDTNTGGQGENLALQSGGTNTYYANGVQRWLNEKSLYDGQPIRREGTPNYQNYGHYTQAVWKSTTKVGLALAVDAKGTAYVVARYSPAGNL